MDPSNSNENENAGGNKNENAGENEPNNNNDQKNEYEKENFVPVQDYVGEGYTLRDAKEETGEIADDNREEVEKAVKEYFEESYNIEVEIHNIVSAKDGVSVFVESVGEPHFYTIAIVPVDVANEEVNTDKVWSQEGDVERAIQGGLYAMAFEEQFAALDDYLEEITDEYPLTGLRMEAVENVGAHGYSKPEYFISPLGDTFDELYKEYEADPEINKEDLREFFNEHSLKPEDLTISIKLYMEDKDEKPDEEIYEQIYKDIQEKDDFPTGEYRLSLHDNDIDRTRADGKKDNTLDKTRPDGIEKTFE